MVGKDTLCERIDGRGLGCAEPLILAKKALEGRDEVTIVVDQRAALNNVKLLGGHIGCLVDVKEEGEEVFAVRLIKVGDH